MKRLLKRTDLASAAALCARERTRYAFDCVELVLPRKGYRLCATDGKEAVRMVGKQPRDENAWHGFDDSSLVSRSNPGGRYALVSGFEISDALKLFGNLPKWILVEVTRRQVRLAAPIPCGGAVVVLPNQHLDGLAFPRVRQLLNSGTRRVRLAFNPHYFADIGKVAGKHQGRGRVVIKMLIERNRKRREESPVQFRWKADDTEVDALLMPVSR